ncbi:hypothetical protein ACFX15_002791 [Malus domestica]
MVGADLGLIQMIWVLKMITPSYAMLQTHLIPDLRKVGIMESMACCRGSTGCLKEMQPDFASGGSGGRMGCILV